MKKRSTRWQSENRLLVEENQIDWSCKSLQRTECSGSTETIERALCLCPLPSPPCPANKNETLITYDRFSSASKGPCHYFPPSTTAILPIIRRHERVQPGLSQRSEVSRGNVPHFVNSQWSWVATYLHVALTRMMLPVLFAIRVPNEIDPFDFSVHSIFFQIAKLTEQMLININDIWRIIL